jgi:uncharacterized phage-associated protein
MGTKKLTALDVANYVISIASANVIGDEGEVEGVTNLKLQKILYFIEAYSLAVTKKSLFSDQIEAWDYGPVIPTVYHEFKSHGSDPISIDNPNLVAMKQDTKEMIEGVWNTFNKYSASRLVDITHSHNPWKNAFKVQKGGLKQTCVIDRDEMKEYYTGLFT